jgi:hypothetical protein
MSDKQQKTQVPRAFGKESKGVKPCMFLAKGAESFRRTHIRERLSEPAGRLIRMRRR